MNIDPSEIRDTIKNIPDEPPLKKYKLDAIESIACDSLIEINTTNSNWNQRVIKNGLELQFAPSHLLNDPELVLAAIKQNPSAIRFASKELKNDEKVVLEAVKRDGMTLYFASNELKDNYTVVITALIQNCHALCFASDRMKKNDAICEFAALKNPNAYFGFGSESLGCDLIDLFELTFDSLYELIKSFTNLIDDKDVKQYLTQLKPSTFIYHFPDLTDYQTALNSLKHTDMEFVPKSIPRSRELCLKACEYNANNFIRLPKEIQYDKDFILDALRVNYSIVKYLPNKIIEKNLVLECLKNHSNDEFNCCFHFDPHSKIWDDLEFLKECLEICGDVLQFAPPTWKNDKQIALNALCKKGNAFNYISPDLRNDKEIVLAAFKNNPRNLWDISRTLLGDEEIINLLKDKSHVEYFKLPDQILDSKEIIKCFVSKNYEFYLGLDEHLNSDWEIALEALKNELKQKSVVFSDLLKEFKIPEDEELFYEMIYFFDVVENMPTKLLDDKKFFIKLVELHGMMMKFSETEEIDKDKNICLTAVKSSGRAIQYCSEEFKDNLVIVREALKNDIRALQHVSNRLKQNSQLILDAAKSNSGERIAYALLHNLDLLIEIAKQLPYEKQRAVLVTLKTINAPFFGEVKSALIGAKIRTILVSSFGVNFSWA